MNESKFQRVIKFDNREIYKQLKTAAVEDNTTIGNEIKSLLILRQNYRSGKFNEFIVKKS